MAAKAKDKVVAVDRPAGTYSVMFGGIRIDLAYKPLFDSLASTRIQRHTYCRKHEDHVHQAWHCATGDHYVPATEVAKMTEAENGKLVEVSDDDLKKLIQPNDSTVELLARLDYVDPVYVEKTYAIWPADITWVKPYKMLHNLLGMHDSALIGMLTEDGTTKILAFRMMEDENENQVMVAHLCHHAITLRKKMLLDIAAGVSGLEDPKKEEMDLAMAYYDLLPDHYELDAYVDDLGIAQRRLVEAKAHGDVFVRGTVEVVETTDLVAAMRAEVAKKTAAKEAQPKVKASEKTIH